MSRIEDRLVELGSPLPAVAKPVASYTPAVVSGNLVFTSGQLPFIDGVLPQTGKLGAGVDADAAKGYARQCALNALAAVKLVIGDLDRVTRVVKLVGFVASVPEFSGQPGVINGASEFLNEVFGDAGKHTRTTDGLISAPFGVTVEVEAIVELNP
jgi:enamine deaminase RidA (YjgF/YER057c/UK114 family)